MTTVAPALVFDTNIISLPIKDGPSTRYASYRAMLDEHTIILSFVTVAEVWKWVEERRWGERKRGDWTLLPEQCVVNHSTPGLCQVWAYLVGLSKRGGHNLGHADA